MDWEQRYRSLEGKYRAEVPRLHETLKELRTTVSGAVFSGYMVLMIGVGSVFLMNVVNPGSLDLLAANLIGQIVLGVAATLFVLGFLLIRRITSVEV